MAHNMPAVETWECEKSGEGEALNEGGQFVEDLFFFSVTKTWIMLLITYPKIKAQSAIQKKPTVV